MRFTVDKVMVSELALYATKSGDLYERRLQPVCLTLARHAANGNYAFGSALRAFGNLVPEIARCYAVEFNVSGLKLNPDERVALAEKLLAEYEEHIEKEAASLRNDKHLRAVWPMAAIRYAVSHSRNSSHFFDRKTLQFFGETMRDYRRRVENGTVYVDRLSSRAGRKTYIFDTETHEMREIRDQEG